MPHKQIIALAAPVAIEAAKSEGETKTPAKFTSTFYTGGAMDINGWEHPVVIDLAGLEPGNVLVANLDHDQTKRVGNFELTNADNRLVANGTATAATPARDEVVNSAKDGYQWQASLEVNPTAVEEVASGKTVTVNGQTFTGPLCVTRKGVLKGFAFVSHGADDNTSATIAANAASKKEKGMKPEIKAWAEKVYGGLFNVDSATPEQVAVIEANYAGQNASKPVVKATGNPFEDRKIEARRKKDIREIADKFVELRNADEDEIIAIEKMHDHAIEAGMLAQDFRLEMYEAGTPVMQPIRAGRHDAPSKLLPKVLEAAVCMAGRLEGHEKMFDDQTLQMAHERFRSGISLKQLFLIAAEMNGHKTNYSSEVTIDVQRAAFGMLGPQRQVHAAGFSGYTLSTALGNIANKFIRVGWDAIDMTPMRIAYVRPVTNFQQITTTSLTGDLQYLKVGNDGEIKHGTLSETTYNNQADTYARMLAITRKDIINDDLGVLTSVPRRLGRGAALKLNDIFWTAFLNNSSFFTSGNSNVNTGVADMTLGGLDATETTFTNQTDPDGKPLGVTAKILLVPPALKNKALTLMTSEKGGAQTTTFATGPGDGNPFAGRFRVESSPYMANSSYTGYDAAAWYMLADPNDLPVIEIVALNGRVEPTVDTADADFNTLGVQMRGYSDIGCALQEKRGGVRADGGSS